MDNQSKGGSLSSGVPPFLKGCSFIFSLSSLVHRLRRHGEVGAFLGLLIIFIVFSVMSPNTFLSFDNIGSILTSAASLGIVAIGVTFLMTSGEFDLSVSSTYAIIPMILAFLVNSGINPIIGLLAALLCAVLIGSTNALITIKGGIPSFIVTLGMMMFIRGIIFAVTGGIPVTYEGNMGLISFLNMRFGGSSFRIIIFWFIGLVILFAVILRHTKYGNWVFATGGNKLTARIMGIDTQKVKFINFIIASVLAGLAGIIGLGRFMVVEATLGRNLELEAIAASVIGGTHLMGGYGTIIGTAIGVSLVGMVRSGLVLVGAPSYWYRAFVGLILIIAVLVNKRIKS